MRIQKHQARRGWRVSVPVVLLAVMGLVIAALCSAPALYPEASGGKVFKKNGLVMDYSHADQGYIMVKYTKNTTKKLKLYVKGDKSNLEYKPYDLNGEGEYEVFPLQYGSGTYKIQLYLQAKGTKYTSVASKSIKVELQDGSLPYLYPNQYVWYTKDSAVVQKSNELCRDAQTDAQRVELIRSYLASNIMYDYVKAFNAASMTGYLPNVDELLESKMGICFDYAALMASMLRAQGIPARMVIGYADTTYHAWNNVLINGEWAFYDVTSEATKSKFQSYTPERWY